MPNTALATRPRSGQRAGNDRDDGDDAAPAIAVPFVQASRERLEAALDNTDNLGESVSQVEIPALGFLRYLVIRVDATGGSAGLNNAVAEEDAPFNVLQSFQVSDVNGNPIYGPFDLYKGFIVDKHGGYTFASDARSRPNFSDVDDDGNFSFVVRVPLEISGRDALGALANMNASQTYKVSYNVATSGQLFSTAPDTEPSVRVRVYHEAWAQPRLSNEAGAAQSILPPMHGATQYWSLSNYTITSGENLVRLARVGGLIRMLILIFESSSARDDSNFPDDLRLEYDGSLISNTPKVLFQDQIYERYGYDGTIDAANGRDTGVYLYSWAHDLDGKPGWENRLLYLPTTQATRLEVRGNFGAAGTLHVLTNDLYVPAVGGGQ